MEYGAATTTPRILPLTFFYHIYTHNSRSYRLSVLLQQSSSLLVPIPDVAATANTMRNSSNMGLTFQACTILTLAIASTASQSTNDPTPVTFPPPVSTPELHPRFLGQVVPGPCSPFDHYVTVTAGSTCESLAISHAISFDELLLMNPELSKSCDNLIAGESYCVGAAGSAQIGPPALSCKPSTAAHGSTVCSCNDDLFYATMATSGSKGPCDFVSTALPATMSLSQPIPVRTHTGSQTR